MVFPRWVAGPIAVAVLMVVSGHAVAQSASPPNATAARQVFDIPALPATQALQRFVEQTRFQLLYSPETIRGIKTKPISGVMAPREALEKMLVGSGVAIVDTGDGAATLRSALAEPRP